MRAIEARHVIAEILASIPDGDLPELRREDRDDTPCYWHGGRGWHIGSSTVDGRPAPANYRRTGVGDALVHEALHRIEQQHWAEREATP